MYLNVVQKAVYIASDGGRVCRPLLVCKGKFLDLLLKIFSKCQGGKLKLTQEHVTSLGDGTKPSDVTLQGLIKSGVIEYVDVNEENNCLIALCETDLTPG